MWHLRWVFRRGWRLFKGEGCGWHRHHKHHHHKHKVRLVVPDPTKPAKWG
jgi:hypothetical protein